MKQRKAKPRNKFLAQLNFGSQFKLMTLAAIIVAVVAGGGYYLSSGSRAASCTVPNSATTYQTTINKLGYAGFDGGYSTPTPYGAAWTTGDSIKNNVLYANNLFIQRPSGCWQVITNAVPNNADGTFHWLLASTWDGNRLRVAALHGRRTSTGWDTLGTDIATFRLTSTTATLESVLPTPAANDGSFAWVSALTTTGGYHYLYGAKNQAYGCNTVYVARIPQGQLTTQSAWRYWNGTSWGTSRTAAADVHQDGLCWSSGFSVTYSNGRWKAVGKDGGFGTHVLAYTSPKPTGPWTASAPLMTLDSTTTYLAMAHPEATLASHKTLVSWSVSNGIIHFGEITLP